MAPIIAIGSTALVAGTAASAGATAKKAVSPSIKICEAAPGAFRFALNGSLVSLNGKCEVFTAKIGVNHVTEVLAPAWYRSLSSISVAPAQVRVNSSLKTESATLRLAAGKSATVTFANSKLVVVVSGPAPVTPPSNPGPTAGGSPGGGSPGGGSPGPVGNPDPVTTGNGYIEICQTAGDSYVEGSFSFSVSEGTTPVGNGTYSLTPVYGVGEGANANTVCTGAIPAAAGTVTITEANYGPGYWLGDVTASGPAGALGTVDLATQTASFTVDPGIETTADFFDYTQYNFIKVCKVLANNLGNLAGTTFNFAVGWTFTPATTGGSKATFGSTESVGVVAVPAPGEQCSIVPEAIPAGSVVTVNEVGSDPTSFVSVSNVSIVPPQFDAATLTTPATEAVLTVPPVNPPLLAGGYADAVFTDTPMGFMKVCKYFDPSRWDNEYNFATFTVNGGSSFQVQGGDCSAPIEVPAGAGTATVDESLGANYNLEGISAVAFVLAGPSLIGGWTNELTTGATVNPAIVDVNYGDPGYETIVSYTNAVDPTAIEICALDPAATPTTPGQTVKFTDVYVDTNPAPELADMGTVPGPRIPDLTISAGDPTPCEVIYGPPVIDPWGFPYELTITETSISGPPTGQVVTGIAYAGNGTYSTAGIGTLPASISVTLGLGVNEVTFTNGPPEV